MVEMGVQSLGFAEVAPDGAITQFTRQVAYRRPAMLMVLYGLPAIQGNYYDYLSNRAPQHFGADHGIAGAEKMICESDELPCRPDSFLSSHSIWRAGCPSILSTKPGARSQSSITS